LKNIPYSITRCATIFVITLILVKNAPAGSARERVLHRFKGGNDGATPQAGLVADQSGNLYGTTSSGGNGACQGGCGTVFRLSRNLDRTWSETQLYSFSGGTDGAFPYGQVAVDANGNVFGTTSIGGTENFGVIFEVTP